MSAIRGALVVILAVSRLTLAGDVPKPSSSRYDFLGVVGNIDPSARTIVVRYGRKPQYQRVTIRFDANTEIVRSKKRVSGGDIQLDARIWVYLREDRSGKKTDLARRLTLADPYPDINGIVESIDRSANKLVVSRKYPGGGAKDRRQTIEVRFNRGTKVILEGREARIEDIPLGRRVAITSARSADGHVTDVAAKISVWRESKRNAKPGGNQP